MSCGEIPAWIFIGRKAAFSHYGTPFKWQNDSGKFEQTLPTESDGVHPAGWGRDAPVELCDSSPQEARLSEMAVVIIQNQRIALV